MNSGRTTGRSRRPSPCSDDPKSVAFVLGLFCFATFFFYSTPDPQLVTLNAPEVTKVLIVVNRHGARSALQHFTFEDFSWDVPLGQLSVLGMHQAFELGAHLRTQHFMDEETVPAVLSKIAAYSTYIDRATETARAVILGIAHGDIALADYDLGDCSCREAHVPTPYSCIEQCIGISESLRWNTSLPDVHIIDRNSSEISWMMQYSRCKGFSDAAEAVKRTEDFLYESEVKFKFHFDLLKQIVGGNEVCKDQAAERSDKQEVIRPNCTETSIEVLEEVWDDMTAAFYAEKKAPSLQTTPTYVLSLLEEAVLWKWRQEFSKENGKLAGGILLNEILDQISTAIRQPKHSQPFDQVKSEEVTETVIFSGHDKTLTSLLSAMGVENWHYPRYVSYMKFTVEGPPSSRHLSEHRVEIEYDGRSVAMDACKNGQCSLDSFINEMKEQRLPKESCELLP